MKLWTKYSKKLCEKIETARHAGSFTQEEAKARGMRLAVGKQGDADNKIYLYLLVDESDAVIADAKFQVLGSSALIGAAEAACELVIRKNYDQARKLPAELIDRQVRDKASIPAFPEEAFASLNLVLDAIEEACEQCLDIPFLENYVPTPIDPDNTESERYPGWDLLNKEQRITVIEEVIQREIRPYIELDAGGVQIVDLIDGKEVIIAYQGACTTCYSAIGGTLNAIQEILQVKVDPSLIVTPDASSLNLVQ